MFVATGGASCTGALHLNIHTGVIWCYCILNMKNKSKQQFIEVFHIKRSTIVTLRKLHLYVVPLHRVIANNLVAFTCNYQYI